MNKKIPGMIVISGLLVSSLASGQGPGTAAGTGVTSPALSVSSGACANPKPDTAQSSEAASRQSSLPTTSLDLQSRMQVQWRDAKLTVKAEGVPLAAVLQEIACQTGLVVQGLQNIEGLVHVEFSGLGLEGALRNLLTGVDYAALGDLSSPQQVKRAHLLILGRHGSIGRAQAANGAHAVRAGSDTIRIADAVEPPPAMPDLDALGKQIMSPDAALQETAFNTLAAIDAGSAVEALEAAIKNGDPAARLQALQLLDRFPLTSTEAIFSALEAALGDSDMNMKLFAIRTLARRGGSEAMDLLDQALNSPDTNIRLMVIQTAAENKEDEPLLRRALGDPDQAVAAAASALLNQSNSAIEGLITTEK